MAVRAVVRYPDPALKRPAEPVGRVTPRLRDLAADLTDTMRAGPATVGLAAPQVGVSVRALVLDVDGHPRAASSHGLVALFDPVVEEEAGAGVLREGCLSVPHLTADVRRPTSVTVRGLDLEGRERRYRMEGFEARVLLHEVDHLDGVLILDRASGPAGIFPRRVYR